MKTLVFLLALTAIPAVAQESLPDGSVFDALKLGDWVTYASGPTQELLNLSVIEKPADTNIARYWEDLEKERTASRAAQRKANAELQAENLTREERQARIAEFAKSRDETARERIASRDGRGGFSARNALPYEVTSIRKEYVVLSNGTEEQFIPKSAVRMIRRKLRPDAPKASSAIDTDQIKADPVDKK